MVTQKEKIKNNGMIYRYHTDSRSKRDIKLIQKNKAEKYYTRVKQNSNKDYILYLGKKKNGRKKNGTNKRKK